MLASVAPCQLELETEDCYGTVPLVHIDEGKTSVNLDSWTECGVGQWVTHCYKTVEHGYIQGGSDGSGRQSCKCNYVDITKMPGPHADTARVMPGAHADIAHTVCVKPGPYADTVCVKPGPHADIN